MDDKTERKGLKFYTNSTKSNGNNIKTWYQSVHVYALHSKLYFSGTMVGIAIRMYFGLLSGGEGITVSINPGRLKVCPTN